MSQGRTPTARTKLPAAASEAAPKRTNPLREFAGWIVAAILLIGGGTYWLVDRSDQPGTSEDPSVAGAPTSVVQQPDSASDIARTTPSAKPQKAHRASHNVASPPGVGTGAAPSGPSGKARSVGAADAKTTADCKCARPKIASVAPASVHPKGSEPTKLSQANDAVKRSPLWPRPGERSEQVHGRVVHVGAFSDVQQAKFVWGNMVRSYPPVAQFQPSLVQNRDWNGKAFYQFQVETASEADSEMLCQSIERFNYRCAVMGVHSIR
jgi:hypothetical protein